MPLAVLFDIDGTLVDSNEAHVDSWVAVFTREGYAVDRDAIRGQIGKGGDMLVPALLPGVAEDEVTRLSDLHGEVFKAQHLRHMRPFPGAHDLLARARAAGLRVALASSGSKGEVDWYLGLLDARALVEVATSIDDASASKPAGDIFQVALERLGVAGDQAVAVGDTPYDLDAAAKCGVPAVALLSGGFSADALAGAAAVYADTADLLQKWNDSPLARN